MTLHSQFTAADRDRADWDALNQHKLNDLLAYSAKKSGRSVLQIGREFTQMSKSDRKISIGEFVRWGLYDPTRHSPEIRETFISNAIHWPITHTCNNNAWNGAAEDKVLASTILSAGGVAVPETVAVIDKTARIFPGIVKISSPEALRDLILGLGTAELFGKMVDGMVSFGAFSVESADKTHITCVGQDPMTYSQFLSEFIGDNSYMIQKRLKNHAEIDKYSTALATVRTVNLVKKDGIRSPISIISLPQGNNVADTLWRHGNLACEVDVESGRILTMVRNNGCEIEFLDDHPSIPGLMGLVLPHWDKLREVNRRAAEIFAPIRYQSTDIGITQDGPVVVELNYGSGFGLPQNASGRGLLTQEVREFFEECGYTFGQTDKKKKSGFSFFGRG